MEIYGRIYKITNVIDEKVYIGQTTQSFDERYAGGLYNSASNKYFKEEIKKYGEGAFEIEKEFDVAYSRKELDEKEKYWIEYYCSNVKGMGYNICVGGTNTNKGVVQLTLDGEYVNEFTTIAEAYYKTGSLDFEISQCCRGIKKEVDGYKWVYRKEYYEKMKA